VRQAMGVVGGLGFMLVIMGDGLRRDVPAWDLLLASAVPLTYAVANTYVKQRFAGVSALALSMTALLASGGMLLPLSLGTEQIEAGEGFGGALAALLVLGVLATGLAMFVFYRLIHDHGPLYAGMVAYAIPAIALLWGWLDGEALTALQVAGLLGIFVMVGLVQWPTGRRREREEALLSGRAG
jgi:drug/metabolite transporter (DMT)-like permease